MNYYFVGYVQRNKLDTVTDEQAKKLTHLNIAFAPVEDGLTVMELTDSEVNELKRIKNINKNLNILVSTGGGGNRGHGEATKTKEGLDRLVASTIDIVKKYDLDGIDCDWEFPGDTGIIEEKYQHTLLFKAYREQLDLLQKQCNKYFWLTTAAGCGKWYIDRTEIETSHKYLDFINLMTYDSNTNTNITGHHTHLFNSKQENAPQTQSADYHINLLTNIGIPKDKILIGVAFYSHMWTDVENKNNGLYQKSRQNNVYGPNFHDILNIYEKDSNFKKYFDEDAKAPYLFNGNTFISYDDTVSTKLKVDYAKENNLKGVFYWVHSSDNTSTLFNTIYDNLF